MEHLKKRKVVIGLSGGVDSAASAFILKRQGYEVIALYFDVLGKGEAAAMDAKLAAERLEIKFIYRDVSHLFRKRVISYFYNEYVSGRTPNPCVLCNKEIKSQALLAAADEHFADHIATGHYARIEKREEDGLYYVKIAVNTKKDQSYVLWKLGQAELSRLLFPLGEMESKDQIREILRKEGFENAEKRDSQEICFIENDDYIAFLKKNMGWKEKKGLFVDRNGKPLGEHQGIIHYTIGQRKGLGVTFGKPVYVTAIDAKKNMVTLGDNEDLFYQKIYATNINFCGRIPQEGAKVRGKIRYTAGFADCTLSFPKEGGFVAAFENPQRAPTPGQSLVLYDGDDLLGGGLIASSLG